MGFPLNKETELLQRQSQLIAGCIACDKVDQYRFYKEYFSFTIHIARRYTSSDDQAKSITNVAFLKIFDNLSKFDKTKNLKPWISRIVVNSAIDFVRKQKNTVLHQFVELDHTEIDHSEDEILEIDIQNLDSILPILKILPPKYKLVFNLYVFEEFSHKEIAARLRISVSTSKTNYMRAKKIIRQEILKNRSSLKIQVNE